jgi:ectoine hydroxylase-related dioxygenase (phytanoyl-CoA dioxygenase family)
LTSSNHCIQYQPKTCNNHQHLYGQSDGSLEQNNLDGKKTIHKLKKKGVNFSEGSLSSKKNNKDNNVKMIKTDNLHVSDMKTSQLKRRSQEDINNLVKGLGLRPVQSNKSSSSTKKVLKEQNNTILHPQLHTSQVIPIEIQLQYARNGHAVLRNAVPVSLLHDIRLALIKFSSQRELDAYKQKVEVATKSKEIANRCTSINECIEILREIQMANNTEDEDIQLPFLQYFNTWRVIPIVHQLVTSPLLSKMAQILLDVPKVKLYQDSLFHKRMTDGPTPWHSDLRMTPFDTSNMITFWIPLNDIPHPDKGGTGLWFVDKSHSDFALPYWNTPPSNIGEKNVYSNSELGVHSNSKEYDRLDYRYGGEASVKHHMPMKMGDITVHSGWTLHCANGNNSSWNENSILKLSKDRYALAVSYVDANAEIRENVLSDEKNNLGHHEDRQSYQAWCSDVNAREYFEHPLVPIVWPPSQS